MRNLKWLGFRVPLPLVNKAHQANQLYPYAIGLLENVRAYELSNTKVKTTAERTFFIRSVATELR